MKTFYSLIIFVVLVTIDVKGQQQAFDFWIGEWNLSWKSANGMMEYGTNRIDRVLNSKVIEENFEATEGSLKGYIGKSWSVYNQNTEEWKQTWVDNRGAYLDFSGGIDGDKRFFEREAIGPDGDPIRQRMVFYNIKEDSFRWDWERSNDDGRNWTLQWSIQYKRAQ